MLFAGTKIIRVKEVDNQPVLAICDKTGFDTVKGNLIRSILFPKPNKFKFYRDSLRFISVMGALATIGFLYCLYHYIKNSVPAWKVLLRAADLVTIAVPPALPVAMTIGTTVAIRRLKKSLIYCISPPKLVFN